MSLLDLQGMESDDHGSAAMGSISTASVTGCAGGSGGSLLLCASLLSTTLCL